ncbi:MAG: CoA-binding protein [Candidatus Wukongarchaeota archaeon]|nr:CoA-binding protein [Candidatus Wukongarchaeota archaeon]MDO8129422.1 CoA-binding protein [Candidatus Wukongarchaeota archaeon]
MISFENEEEAIRYILENLRVIAVVGMSRSSYKPSHGVPKYLKEHGYRIIPVNPNTEEILGEKCYPDLLSVPEKVEVVEVFRPSEEAPGIVDQAIKKKVKVVWLQLGIINDEAGEKARKAGIIFIQNRCMMIEYQNLHRSYTLSFADEF